MLKYFFLIIFLSISFSISAKQPVTDSLLLVLDSSQTDEEEANVHLAIAKENEILNDSLARFHAKAALNLGEETENYQIIGKSYYQLGVIEDYKYQYDTAFGYLDTALHFLKLVNDTITINKVNLVYARANCYLGKCEEAVDDYNRAEVGIDPATIAFHRIRVNHIICLQNCRFYDQCIELCNQSLPFAKQIQDSIWQMYYYILKGNSLVQINQPQLALAAFDSAFMALTLENAPVYKGSILNNRADAYEALGFFEKAKADYANGIAHNIENNIAEDNSRAYVSLALISKKTGDYAASEKFFQKALSEMYKTNDYTVIADTHLMFAEVLATIEKPDSAFHHVFRAYKLRDSVFTEEVRIKTKELNVKYETERVKRELAQSNLQVEIEQNQRRLLFFGSLGILFLGVAVGTYVVLRQRQRRLRVEKRKVELEYGLLRAQMNPHFVFNSLNSIQGYFANNDFKAGNQFLGKFSRLIRRVLDQSVTQEVTLADEIDTLKLYLDLEAVRLKNRLHYAFHYPPDLEIDLICVPPLILQPFVENAIWHGIAPKTGAGKIDIFLKTNATEDRLFAIIEDDGVGLTTHKNSTHQSRGVQITRERLGVDSSVEIQNRTDQNGVRVELEFGIGGA